MNNSEKNVVFGAILPHPPIIVPEVGKSRLQEALATKQGAEEVCRRLKSKNAETMVIITPHGSTGFASLPVYTGHVFEGDFSRFGAPRPHYNFKGDPQFGQEVIKDCDFASRSAETLLDHGALVPLSYVERSGVKARILPVAIALLPLPKLFSFGKSLAATAKRLGRKIAIIASADMSHCLKPDAPGGYNPKGKVFDDKLVELVKNYAVQEILSFPADLAEEAGQDALWSIAVLLGALDGKNVKHEVLSYEGPFGVGYMTAAFELQ
jgi:AmmeMemoRadiSam system protein B